MTSREVLLIITSIGAIQSILLGMYFFTSRNKDDHSNLLLGVLLIALGVRVGKSTLFIFAENVPLFILNIGFAAHALSAPLLFLYVKSFQGAKKLSPVELLHLLPFVTILVLCTELTLENFWYSWGYSGLLYYSLGYIALTYTIFIIDFKKYQRHELKWLLGLIIGISLFLVAYFSNYILRTNSYITAPIIYSAVVYFLSFLILQNQSRLKGAQLKKEEKYKYLNVSDDRANEYRAKILSVMSNERPYLDSDFNLTKLSELTSIPGYTLSYMFSNFFDQKFNEFINKYRIEEAKKKLKDPVNDHYKISALAYECGFNSLSAFNVAFKKFTKSTPSQFRDSSRVGN